mmetsp:Transcript_26771/g.78860  ORF Transcript_26771/g.78860 Transcript_26771/m.78860 type:complete len:202 (+) Transcript_26771:324-929(+)
MRHKPVETVLHCELHDRVDDVALVLFERRHRLPSRHPRLGHDKLNVFALHTCLINVTVIHLLNGRLRLRHLGGLGWFRCVELLGGVCLSLGAEIFDLRLAKDDVGVGGRRLENVRLLDDKEDVLRLLDRHAHDARHGLHAQLLHGLAALLLAAALLLPGTILVTLNVLKVGNVVVIVVVVHIVVVVDLLDALVLLGHASRE